MTEISKGQHQKSVNLYVKDNEELKGRHTVWSTAGDEMSTFKRPSGTQLVYLLFGRKAVHLNTVELNHDTMLGRLEHLHPVQ